VEDKEIGDETISESDKEKMRNIIRRYSHVFLDGSNAAPPQVRGALCDIDVQGAKPVAQKARKVRPEHLEQLHKLLKALLQNKMIKLSNSDWASPIVVVLKKDGKTIRLCIDYREVNALTKLMIASMPLIDDLLVNFEAVMWMCSFDACSGFWSVGMTERASEISPFICPLGHFQWLRMPQGLKNAPQIYQRMIDNALWGGVRPKYGWERGDEYDTDANGVAKDMFVDGVIEASTNLPVVKRRSYIDDFAFHAKTWEQCCILLERFLSRMSDCKISLSWPKSEFGKKVIEYLSHLISREGIAAKPKHIDDLMNRKISISQTCNSVVSWNSQLL
jgi:hypothetical protein